MNKKVFFFVFICILVNSQKYSDYRLRYDNFEENDERALEFVNDYIAYSRTENNYKELTQAYRDAVSFSRNQKLQYADSAIWSAHNTKDHDIIGNAYLTKGSVYYFTNRKYQLALDEYLKAWKYLKESKDLYLYYKNMYHIGVVKSYLGHYNEAFILFSKCRNYYGKANVPEDLPNLRYNMKKGYLNSLNQMSICLYYQSKVNEATQFIDEGMKESVGDKNFYLERSYFYKLKGIQDYINKKDKEALSNFQIALAGIEKKNDFTNASVIYYLKGKIFLRNNKEEEAIVYLKKIDTIFLEHDFVLPPVREAYELLINYYKKENDNKKELYYTTQLLKFDQILASNFKYLSDKIHKEYDTNDLLESKKRLESSVFYGRIIVGISLCIVLIFSAIMYYMIKKYNIRSSIGDNRMIQEIHIEDKDVVSQKNLKLPEKLIKEILDKLDLMEQNRFYLEKGFTQNQLAKKLKTNTAYLSGIINEYKGTNFNTYLNRLRIEYAKEMLISSSQWRKYSIETIAHECGFSNRSNFSKFFTELTSFSPPEFIQKINEEINKD